MPMNKAIRGELAEPWGTWGRCVLNCILTHREGLPSSSKWATARAMIEVITPTCRAISASDNPNSSRPRFAIATPGGATPRSSDGRQLRTDALALQVESQCRGPRPSCRGLFVGARQRVSATLPCISRYPARSSGRSGRSTRPSRRCRWLRPARTRGRVPAQNTRLL